MKFSTPGSISIFVAAGFGLFAAPRLQAQAKGSLSELDIENSELKVSLERLREENKQLRNALVETGRTLSDMRKNLATANGEGEIFKRETNELKLRLEALGLDVSSGNNARLEQRLLAAVSDLRIMAGEKKKLTEALVRLSDAVSLYAKLPGADSRLALEAEIRNAGALLGKTSSNAVEAMPVEATISDGMAISVKDDLALVVMNVGSKQGVKVGMPFQVIRGDHIVGSVRVVDVREKIAGAVIQNLTTEKDHIKVGDHLKVDAHP